jgi:arabinogalactan endo-1,4-beta-galactosidase
MFDGTMPPYPMTKQGQSDFVKKVLDIMASVAGGRGKAFYYWEIAWLPVKGSTWSTEAARCYINETQKQGGNEWANQCLFDYEGNSTPALKVLKNFNGNNQ